LHSLCRFQTTIQQGDNRLGNGHVHAQLLGALEHGAGAVHAFGNMAE
jgi:hypothetical protein